MVTFGRPSVDGEGLVLGVDDLIVRHPVANTTRRADLRPCATETGSAKSTGWTAPARALPKPPPSRRARHRGAHDADPPPVSRADPPEWRHLPSVPSPSSDEATTRLKVTKKGARLREHRFPAPAPNVPCPAPIAG